MWVHVRSISARIFEREREREISMVAAPGCADCILRDSAAVA